MPLYMWTDKNTGKEVTVLRTFAEYESPPTEEEAPRQPGEEPADWVRDIGSNIAVVKGYGWGGKGHW